MTSTSESTETHIHPRKALIIGNNRYTSYPLTNCVNDANDLANTLEKLDFQVQRGIDCDYHQMRSLLREFSRSIQKQDLVLFYFSGIGAQYQEQNYLFPIDADDSIELEADIESASINAQNTLNYLASKTSYITIFILDCSRSYRLASDRNCRGPANAYRGLHPMTTPGGTLTLFSCAPGTAARDGDTGDRNGLFTKHLLKHLATPNKDIEKIFNAVTAGVYLESRGHQIPHRVSAITIDENIYLKTNDSARVVNTAMFSATPSTTTMPRRKLALVIGIGNYEGDKWLDNPENDANDMSSMLQSIGFTVTKGVNLTHDELQLHILTFYREIQPGDLVLFYFSGHGTQWEDQNYLISVDDVSMTAPEFSQQAVNVQALLHKLSNRTPFAMIFLLECGTTYHLCNPDLNARSSNTRCSTPSGLRPMEQAGSLIAYACAPGTIQNGERGQRNGLFTKYLLKYLPTPNKDIRLALSYVTNGVIEESYSQQIPFYTASFRHDDICLCGQSSVTVRWAQNGVTVAGGNEEGDAKNQLNYPHGLFVDEEDTVIVADWRNHRIVEWKRLGTNGTVLAGGKGDGDQPDRLSYPTDVIFDRETDNLIICDRGNRRVTRWPRQSGTQSGETIIDNIYCVGLTMDNERSLYVTDIEKHEVRCYRRGETSGIVVAGGNSEGADLNQLNGPTHVCVDAEHTVYVSDNRNHRVIKWMKGAKKGIIVAGGHGKGEDLTQLSYPNGVIVDTASTVYVADWGNHRVMRWCRGATQGTVVVGGNGEGAAANQLCNPIGLSIGRHDHLFVADCGNVRVQRFSIENS